jgi:hypothetical protein
MGQVREGGEMYEVRGLERELALERQAHQETKGYL